jgi:flagellar L-ring protein precursor FlgH
LRIFLLIIVGVLLASTILRAGQFSDANSRSIFTDIKAHKVGDLVTVLIVEDARATNTAKAVTKKDNKTDINGGPGAGALDFIPLWGLSAENKNEYNGEGQLEKAGSIRAKMTVKVTSINDNGDMVIEGNRTMLVNADKEALYLQGTVRSRDISPSNTIYSYQIADAQVSFKGKGQTDTGTRPGYITRLINWIF